jgi:hypothetical protein
MLKLILNATTYQNIEITLTRMTFIQVWPLFTCYIYKNTLLDTFTLAWSQRQCWNKQCMHNVEDEAKYGLSGGTNLGNVHSNQRFRERSKFAGFDDTSQWPIFHKSEKPQLLITSHRQYWTPILITKNSKIPGAKQLKQRTYSRMMYRCVLVLKDPWYLTMFLWFRFWSQRGKKKKLIIFSIIQQRKIIPHVDNLVNDSNKALDTFLRWSKVDWI